MNYFKINYRVSKEILALVHVVRLRESRYFIIINKLKYFKIDHRVSRAVLAFVHVVRQREARYFYYK